MAESENSDKCFNKCLTRFSTWYDDRKLVRKLKVLFHGYIAEADLDEATKTMDLLNHLTDSGDLSSKDLTILYDTIKATKQFGIVDQLQTHIPSIPNIKDIIISKFSLHQLKILNFGNVLRKEDVDIIDNVYNKPPKNYSDGWGLIIDLQYRQIICEDTKNMEDFIETLEELKLNRPTQTLTRDVTVRAHLKRKITNSESKDHHLPQKRTFSDIPSSLQNTPTETASSVQRNLDEKLRLFQRTVDEILQSLKTVSKVGPSILKDINANLQSLQISTLSGNKSTVLTTIENNLQSLQRTINENLQSLQSTTTEDRSVQKDIDKKLRSLQRFLKRGQQNLSKFAPNICDFIVKLYRSEDTVTNDDEYILFQIVQLLVDLCRGYGCELKKLEHKCIIFHLAVLDPMALVNLKKMDQRGELLIRLSEILVAKEHQQAFQLDWITQIDDKKYEEALCLLEEEEVIDSASILGATAAGVGSSESPKPPQHSDLPIIVQEEHEQGELVESKKEQSDAPTERFPINPISAIPWAFGKVFTSGAQTSATAADGSSSKQPQGTDLTMNIQEDTQGEIVESKSEQSESVSWWRRKWRSIFKRGDASKQALGASTIAKTKKLPVSVELETGKSEDVSYRVMEELPSTLIGEKSEDVSYEKSKPQRREMSLQEKSEDVSYEKGKLLTTMMSSGNLREYVRMKWKQKQEKLAKAMKHRLQITSRDKSEDVPYGKTSLGGIGDSQDFSSRPKVPSTMPDEDCIDEICTTLRRCYNYRMYDKSAFTDTDIIQSLRRSNTFTLCHRITRQSERTEDMGRMLAHCLIIADDEHFFLLHVYYLCNDNDVVKGLSSELHRFNFQYNIERFSLMFRHITALFLIHLLSNTPMLQTLDLVNVLTSDTLMNTVNTLSTNKVLLELDHLDMWGNDLSNIKGNSLGVLLAIAPKLRHLNISHCCLSGAIVDSMINECVTRKLVLELDHLDMPHNDLSNIKGSSLGVLLAMAPKLRRLDIYHCCLSGAIVDSMINECVTRKLVLELDHLDIWSNDLSNIKGSSLGVLLAIAPKLRHLDISHCHLSGAIVDSMINECVTRKLVLELEKLDIEGNDLSNIKGSSLNKLLSIAPKLRYLYMRGCNVPDDVVDNMRKHFTSVEGLFNH